LKDEVIADVAKQYQLDPKDVTIRHIVGLCKTADHRHTSAKRREAGEEYSDADILIQVLYKQTERERESPSFCLVSVSFFLPFVVEE